MNYFSQNAWMGKKSNTCFSGKRIKVQGCWGMNDLWLNGKSALKLRLNIMQVLLFIYSFFIDCVLGAMKKYQEIKGPIFKELTRQ